MSLKLIALLIVLISVVPFGNAKEATKKSVDNQLEVIEDKFTPRVLGEIFGTILGCRTSGRVSREIEFSVLGEGRFEAIADAKVQGSNDVNVFDKSFYSTFENAQRGDIDCVEYWQGLEEYINNADRYNRLIKLSKKRERI